MVSGFFFLSSDHAIGVPQYLSPRTGSRFKRGRATIPAASGSSPCPRLSVTGIAVSEDLISLVRNAFVATSMPSLTKSGSTTAPRTSRSESPSSPRTASASASRTSTRTAGWTCSPPPTATRSSASAGSSHCRSGRRLPPGGVRYPRASPCRTTNASPTPSSCV